MKKYIYILILSSFLLQSCYKDIGPVEETSNIPLEEVSFSKDVQPVFNQYCISCHPNSGNLNLTQGNAYGELVNVNASGYSGVLVIPGDSENSILYKKIDGSNLYGSNMPLGTSLPANQIAIIKKWIDDGAKNN
jgi:hypothetical protein